MKWELTDVRTGVCKLCGSKDGAISAAIGVCVKCLRERFSEARSIVDESRRILRSKYGLPPAPPKDGGLICAFCSNKCLIPSGSKGYCGVVRNNYGRLSYSTGSFRKAIGLYYYDSLPTNCVADWVCPGCTGAGYPKYSLSPRGPERGFYNIAVFYGACNLDCLYCQNWEYREMVLRGKPELSVEDLVNAVNKRTTCACFFGGDPGPQAVHALMAARSMVRRAEEIGLKVFRVCWETNGLMSPGIVDEVVELSLSTGGIVKVDVKAWSPEVYYALTGNYGRDVFKTVERIAERFSKRPKPPLLVVSTLLVPGYVDEVEVEGIVKFIAELNKDIPFRLLAFHPDYAMSDLPPTSRSHARAAYSIALRHGLTNVSIGNWWILKDY